MADLQSTIRKYIVEEIMFKNDPSDLNIDEPLLENGIIDSAGILQLVAFLEKRFNISVSNKDLVPENFETVQSISGMVQRLK